MEFFSNICLEVQNIAVTAWYQICTYFDLTDMYFEWKSVSDFLRIVALFIWRIIEFIAYDVVGGFRKL